MKHLLLLHGAVGSKDQLEPIRQSLSNDFEVSSFNFPGHGGEKEVEEFSIPFFAAQVLRWMEQNRVKKISIFGYSMGGYVGLYLARFYPNAVEEIITLGTKLHWDQMIAAKETAMLNPEIIEQKVPKFAAQLAKRHHPSDWKIVLHKTVAMLTQMGVSNPLKAEDFYAIDVRVLLILGDRDKMVTLDETTFVYHKLKEAQLAIMPGTPHPIENVDPELLTALIKKFLQ